MKDLREAKIEKGTAIAVGVLAAAGIGGYLFYRYEKAKWERWLEELPGGLTYIPPVAAPTPYERRLAAKYDVPPELVSGLIASIPETTLGPPPEVVAEKILAQEFM